MARSSLIAALPVGLAVAVAASCALPSDDEFAQGAVAVGGDGASDGGPGQLAVDASYGALVVGDRPIAYYRMDDVTTPAVHDLLAGGDGIYTGDVTLGVAGAINGDPSTAVSFSSGEARVASRFAFTGARAWSFEAWIKPASDAYRSFMTHRRADGGAQGYNCYLDAADAGAPGLTRAVCERAVADVHSAVTASFIPNAYNHFVLAYDGATMRVYVNGVVAEPSAPDLRAIPDVAPDLVFGTFGMSVDEVAVYDHALGAAQVAAHHRRGVAP